MQRPGGPNTGPILGPGTGRSQAPVPGGRRVGPYEQSLREGAARAEQQARKRASASRRRKVAVGALALVVLGGAGYGGWKVYDTRSHSVPTADIGGASVAAPSRCSEPPKLTVAVPGSMVAAFTATVRSLSGTSSAPCASFTITPAEAASTARAMAGPMRPDGWVVDNAEWLSVANQQGGLGLQADAPFARSALVVGMPESIAGGLADQGWASLLTASSPLRFPDPTTSTAGLLAATAASTAPEFTSALSASVTSPAEPDLAGVADGSAGYSTPLSEAEVLAWNSAHPDKPLAAVAPEGDVAPFEYSLVAVSDNTSSTKALRALQDFLASSTAGEVLAEHGFRVDDAAPPKAPSPGFGQVRLGQFAADAARKVLQRWLDVAPKRQVTVALDVSGSLLDRLDGVTRLKAVQAGVQGAVAGLPPSSTASLWLFSQHIGPGGDDARNVAPLGSLTSPGQVQAVAKGLADMRRFVGGGAGVYDGIATAYGDARARYATGRQNVVVVVVDGPNEDDYGRTLGQVKAALAAGRSASAPLPLFIVGIGPKVDSALMEQLAAPTGGGYVAVSRADDLLPALRKALNGQKGG